MNNIFIELNQKTKAFNLGCKEGTIDMDNVETYIPDIINILAKHYKDTENNIYIPYCKDGMALFQEEDRIYIPIFSDKELVNTPNIVAIKEARLKDICDIVYKNITMNELFNNIEEIPNSDYSLMEVEDYISNNPKIDGIMYNPGTDYIFGFDDWIFKALLFKGMGANSFTVYNPETEKEEIKL